MSCSGDREKATAMEEKWDYVNLDDFKSESCWTGFSYFFLWIFLFISLAVYGVDVFTAVNLLAFSRWAGRVEPAIPFYISRWIFAACIIASFVILVYRWIHAVRAMRSGSITRSFLDPLAVRIQSFRLGKKGRGWRRFLVFAELTKDRKAAEYVALYAHFSFQFWMNTVFADGPRQVINAITLYSVMQMDLLPGGKNAAKDDGSSGASQFFNNVKILAEDNNLQAVVLFGMLFTLVIWVLSVLKLISAIVLYLIFLFHHIPAEDGTLSRYCRRKVGQRLKRIVHRKNNKALAKGLKLQNRTPTQPSLVSSDSKPTLPSITGEKVPVTSVASLSRSTTATTLPPYTRSNSAAHPEQNPTLPNLDFDTKPPLVRTTTQTSMMSDSASLAGNAAAMGYSPLDRHNSPAPPVPPLPANVQPTRNMSHSRPYQQTHTPAPEYTSPDAIRADDYFHRSHTPAHAQPHSNYDPYGPRDIYAEDKYAEDNYESHEPDYEHESPYYAQDPYSTQSYTPASTGATPAPYGRSMTPATYRPTPPPQAQTPIQPPPRTFTPMTSATPAPQNGSYAAFNPSMPSHSQTPSPEQRRGQWNPASAGYNFNRANTASPSAMHRAPPGHYFNRSNTHQY
ncbi:uncharacterized protein N7511_001324 [Penicillium nucicola]|uniref:uncharacterized protein n=1 Tax=Penicillium nucicola TaxID=1850975 RepID=UPI002544ECA6|nr:uncharacterized protein N7511_001324 [Penicillium nucicola]KAJ5776313.1 hypothetical protein N7511_001324 [Penicillium nucicola]